MKSRGINKSHRSKASTGAIRFTAGGHQRRVERGALTHHRRKSCESPGTMIESRCGNDS